MPKTQSRRSSAAWRSSHCTGAVEDPWLCVPASRRVCLFGVDLLTINALIDLAPSITHLGEIIPENYEHPTEGENWQAEANWEKIAMYVVSYDENGKDVLGKEKTTIRLVQAESNSWCVSPPYAKLASVVYQINDEARISMDFRTIETEGIDLSLGDTLHIHEIWYHSLETDPDKQIIALVYTQPGPSDKFPDPSIPLTNISSGVHNLIQDDSFQWKFETTQDRLIVALYRFEGFERYTRLDEYVIPIRPGSKNGLVPLNTP